MTTNTTIGGSTATVSQQLLDTMNGTSTASSSSSTSGTSANDLQTTFLQLLVTQLQNQDPTDPMDSSQMTSQLAQIDTVSGIGQLNTSLSSLSTQLSAGQNAQAALLIGSTVLAPGSSFAVAAASSGSARDRILRASSMPTLLPPTSPVPTMRLPMATRSASSKYSLQRRWTSSSASRLSVIVMSFAVSGATSSAVISPLSSRASSPRACAKMPVQGPGEPIEGSIHGCGVPPPRPNRPTRKH